MKKLNLVLALAIGVGIVACNSGSSSSTVSNGWTWIGGSKQINSNAVLQGAQAIPGARDLAVSWTDNSGNLWLFGGYGYNANSESGFLNDLWTYNQQTKVWRLVESQTVVVNVHGVYGNQGIESSNNYPGGRIGAVSWTDSSGNLWLFGGYGYGTSYDYGYNSYNLIGALNDLWKYNISSGKWTWVSGSKSVDSEGFYGIKKVADSLNTPSARLGSVGWADESGNLWLFGGADSISTAHDYNDLWKYNVSSGKWTWVSGESTPDAYGVYGVQQVTNPLNKPGARLDSVGWLDNSGNLWLFGGNGRDGIGSPIGDLNDLWKYNPSNDTWTWMSGSNMTNKYGLYGQMNVASPNSIPGAREHRIPLAWSDPSTGKFWMLAGDGYGNDSKGVLNDLWSFNPVTNQWTWVNGSIESNAFSNYGTIGVLSASNQIGARRDSVGWVQSNGSVMIFGGYGNTATQTGLLNDMWQLTY